MTASQYASDVRDITLARHQGGLGEEYEFILFYS